MQRVLVTGMGIVSPTGCDTASFFSSLVDARSGVRRHPGDAAYLLDPLPVAAIDFNAAEHFSRMQAGQLDRHVQFALVAVRQAMNDAMPEITPDERERAGVYWGTGMGGADTLESAYTCLIGSDEKRLRPLTVVTAMANAAAAQISIEFSLLGPMLSISNACSSSAMAIGEAMRAIRFGEIDVAIVGGSEALLTSGTLRAWQVLGTLAELNPTHPEQSCCPFDRRRSGLVLGEGAAALVLESETRARRRGARIYAELSGYGNAADGQHLARPDAAGQGRAMRAALRNAELRPEQIGYLNAHGTATKIGDVVESEAIAQVFGSGVQDLAISSTKAVHGHLMGAAGAVEFIACVLALTNRFAPPTAHLEEADAACPLNYLPRQGRELQAGHAVMSNSFAFGGGNAVLIARQYR